MNEITKIFNKERIELTSEDDNLFYFNIIFNNSGKILCVTESKIDAQVLINVDDVLNILGYDSLDSFLGSDLGLDIISERFRSNPDETQVFGGLVKEIKL